MGPTPKHFRSIILVLGDQLDAQSAAFDGFDPTADVVWMSNSRMGCGFDPAKSLGEDACPFTTLYWDFLMRHEKLLGVNRRMGFQVRNLGRLSRGDRAAIRKQADALHDTLAAEARRTTR